MPKFFLPIKGMHCRSCEMLIEEQLKEIPGIEHVKVSLKTKQAEIHSSNSIGHEVLKAAVEAAGYEVGINDKKSWFSRNLEEYLDLGIVMVILLTLYFFAREMGLTNLNISTSGSRSLPIVFIVGLTAGISTCMALVGGLVLGISARHAEKHPEATALQNFRPHIYFNIGRIISYFILGGFIGWVGKALELSSLTLGILTMGVAAVMLVLGVQLTKISPRISAFSFSLPPSVAHLFGIRKHHEKEYSHGNSMLVGALTFFLPCGFTQAMQLYAMSTGSFLSGALIMSVFALGTTPGLLGIGGLSSAVRGAFAQYFFKFAGVLVIFFSIFNFSNGFNLTGWTFASFASETTAVSADPNVKLENGEQVVRMEQTAYGYKPNQFTVQKGIPVKWIIKGEDLNSCSSSIVMPKLGIRKNLDYGENIVEFTPEEIGVIKFTCTMGMYPGQFNVVDGTSGNSANTAVLAKQKPIATTTGSCGGGGGGGCGGCGGGFTPRPPVTGKTETVTPQVQPDSQANQNPVAETQVIRATYASRQTDIVPNNFTVLAGKPVRFEIDVKEDGQGCMSTVMVPGLANSPQYLEAGKTMVFEFTPDKTGDYDITCAMGVPRGKITVT